MKNLYAFLLMLSPIALLAQLDSKYCGMFSTDSKNITMEILPVEDEANSCFYVMYYNASASEGEEMFSGSGSCKKSNNRYSVTLDGSELSMAIEFIEGAPLSVNLYNGKNLVASLQQYLDYDGLLEQYRLEEEMMNAETEEYDEEESYESEEEGDYATPLVFSNEKGWALSMLMYSATEGYFAAVSISEGTGCDMNTLEGTIHPGKEEGMYIAETEDGCVFAELRAKGSTVTLTEKKCKSVDRGNCPSLSGTYKSAED